MTFRDLPVRSLAWRLDRDRTFSDLAQEVRERAELDLATFERILRHRGLHVDRERLDSEHPPAVVSASSLIRVYWFEEEPARVAVTRRDVLSERPGVVVVNKPPGIPVQGTRASVILSLETQLQELLRLPWLTPAHRLDRDTSGLILFATSPGAARILHRQFEARTVVKSYLAWTRPTLEAERVDVTGYIYQEPHPRHARYALSPVPCPSGRASETRFERLLAEEGRGLVRAWPKTGRTHQIRIHLASLGSPVDGDRLYGPTEAAPEAPRLLLHAESLACYLPGQADRAFLLAPPPEDFGPAAAAVLPPRPSPAGPMATTSSGC